jgi:3'5'-cyclic nucleotide phosphodiesterase
LESPAFLDALGKLERLIDWNVEVLMSRLAKVVAKRNIMVGLGNGPVVLRENAPEGHLLESVSDVIEMPQFDPRIARHRSCNAGTTSIINQAVRSQLRAYVSRIARCYKDVAFHNFEHASHVALSANKLIKRIITPEGEAYTQDEMDCERTVSLASDLHHSTSGISSDPLTQFAVVFAALIHDVDHAGVPNAQLIKEEDPIAVRYKHKSVAEQNSVQLALGILSEHRYIDLQNCIFANAIERSRFRQLVINSVMATDIVDKELRSLRADRWAKAFYGTGTYGEKEEVTNRKATIVIEHIIQASDVAHTMQHWHVFCKWNEKLYHEMYAAYLAGRSSKDPTVDWYENEIAFFDYYVIPLAQKLKQCGVFGLSSDEYLQNALANRREWVSKGEQVTKAIITRRISIYGDEKSERIRPSIAPIIQPATSSVSCDGHSDDP